jgi:hypothetical protein
LATLVVALAGLLPAPCSADIQLVTANTWTEEARRKDPEGFVDYAVGVVKEELNARIKAAEKLSEELTRLGKEHRHVCEQAAEACEQAEKYRIYYQRGVFPVAIDGCNYADRQSLYERISKVLAARNGFQATLVHLQEVRRATRIDYERLVVEINDLESRLTELAAHRARLAAAGIPNQAVTLIPQVESLLATMPVDQTPHEQYVETFLKRGVDCPKRQAGKPLFRQD